MSHFCPLLRGSATLSMIFREYAAALGGIETFCTKAGINLNIEALLNPPKVFLNNCKSGEYFDKEVAQKKVLDWQHLLQKRRKFMFDKRAALKQPSVFPAR